MTELKVSSGLLQSLLNLPYDVYIIGGRYSEVDGYFRFIIAEVLTYLKVK